MLESSQNLQNLSGFRITAETLLTFGRQAPSLHLSRTLSQRKFFLDQLYWLFFVPKALLRYLWELLLIKMAQESSRLQKLGRQKMPVIFLQGIRVSCIRMDQNLVACLRT